MSTIANLEIINITVREGKEMMGNLDVNIGEAQVIRNSQQGVLLDGK